MIIKEAKFKTKKITTQVRVSDEVYGCDNCRKEIKEYPNESDRLDMVIFQKNNLSERVHFCSWNCLLEYLPKVKSNYFLSLPHVNFDTKSKTKGIDALLRCLKNK